MSGETLLVLTINMANKRGFDTAFPPTEQGAYSTRSRHVHFNIERGAKVLLSAGNLQCMYHPLEELCHFFRLRRHCLDQAALQGTGDGRGESG